MCLIREIQLSTMKLKLRLLYAEQQFLMYFVFADATDALFCPNKIVGESTAVSTARNAASVLVKLLKLVVILLTPYKTFHYFKRISAVHVTVLGNILYYNIYIKRIHYFMLKKPDHQRATMLN